MKVSDKTTNQILVRARTNSEWDCCDFAIISISEGRRNDLLKRLEAIKPFENDLSFSSLNFFDGSVEFYQSGSDEIPDVDEVLADKRWAFVDLNEEEQDNLTRPENCLDCYQMMLYKNGDAKYTAYGKHTGEEFSTERFLLQEFLDKI